MSPARALGTAATGSSRDDDDGDTFIRRKWPWLVGGGVVIVIAGVFIAPFALQPAQIDDDITKRNAKEIARLMEAQIDTELAILGAAPQKP